jgi:hypothetical protein
MSISEFNDVAMYGLVGAVAGTLLGTAMNRLPHGLSNFDPDVQTDAELGMKLMLGLGVNSMALYFLTQKSGIKYVADPYLSGLMFSRFLFESQRPLRDATRELVEKYTLRATDSLR